MVCNMSEFRSDKVRLLYQFPFEGPWPMAVAKVSWGMRASPGERWMTVSYHSRSLEGRIIQTFLSTLREQNKSEIP